LVAAAEASDGFLQIADWATYSTGAVDWFEYDGVHLTARGVDALTGFLATTIDRVLAGEDVSPAAAPWVVLVPGAEGPDVAAVQTALLDAGIRVPGGVDGVYGNDTMAAVAAFQRDDGTLQVTGAVDAATARSLGLHDDTVAEAAPTTAPLDADALAIVAPAPAGDLVDVAADMAVDMAVDDTSSEATSDARGRATTIVVASILVVAIVAAAVVARGRYVATRRRRRRWARTHPATAPRHTVADGRRRDPDVPDDADEHAGRALESADTADV
jgi:hypothetical protein